MSSKVDIREFCRQQQGWLNLELESDEEKLAEEARSKSSTLSRLEVDDISLGLYGRTVVSLSACNKEMLPSHRFTPGDEVEIRSKSSKDFPSGVVSVVTESSVSIALLGRKNQSKESSEEDDIVGEPPLSIISKSSVEVHRKVVQALKELEQHGIDHPVAGRVVLAVTETPTRDEYKPAKIVPGNPQLDQSQIEAIQFCLGNRPVSLIHGPPGTGKTTTVVELIKQAVHTFKLKVLVAAPSNVAVDNVLAKLVQTSQTGKGRRKGEKIRAVRLGHPARLQSDILPYSLEALVQASDGTDIVKDVRKELASFVKIASNPRARYTDKRLAYREIKALRKEVRSREEKVVQSLLSNAHVVLATCVGAANRLLRDIDFDLVVIDEAAQALESACWIPALRGRKLVLAGDHCQLPPTIKSSRPDVLAGLGCTMFERIMHLYGDGSGTPLGKVSRMLTVQYRMHNDIAQWASQALYNGQLQTAEQVGSRTLAQLPKANVDEEGISDSALWLVDTAGCSLHEAVSPSGSRFNEGEVTIVKQHVQAILNIGIPASQIAVISPYNGQVDLLKATLLPIAPQLEIRSVDGFQGGEREAVVLSLVRSSEHGGKNGIGFLGDNRRLNVAVTRAKRHCCVICDSDTVSQSSFIKNLVQWMVEYGDTRSALEYMSDKTPDQLAQDLIDATHLLESLDTAKPAKKEKLHVQRPQKPLDGLQDELVKSITNFARSSSPGSEITLSADLTSADRRLVHETAEKLGIDHVSKGIDGVDRRITLSTPLPPADRDSEKEADASTADGEEPFLVEGTEPDAGHHPSVFTQIQCEGRASSEEEEEAKIEHNEQVSAAADDPEMKSLLGSLAQERVKRLKQNSTAVAQPATSKKNKKKKGQKLGGQRKTAPLVIDDGLDDLDDMAFLDAQVERVQNSHGRVVQGKGKNYRSVVNGILISKPKPEEKKRDARAAASLQSKLKQSQSARKAKSKKKK